MVGAQSEPPRPAGLDYMVEPPSLTHTQESAIGALSVVLALASALVAAIAVRRGLLRLVETRFAVPLVLVGMYVGLCWRVMTAGVVGANIGGGLAMLSLPMVFVVGAIWAVLWRPSTQ